MDSYKTVVLYYNPRRPSGETEFVESFDGTLLPSLVCGENPLMIQHPPIMEIA